MCASKFWIQGLSIFILATVIVLSTSFVWAYGGGGGGTGAFERDANSGCGASFGTMGTYVPYSNGITDHASYQAQFEADVAEEQADVRDGYHGDYHDKKDEGRAVSAIAWDETLDVSPDERKLAFVLENMMANGAINTRQAYAMMAIYRAGKERQRQQTSRSRRRY
nr:hypothetical protein [uncultured Pseudodesulfovibrio sp.]